MIRHVRGVLSTYGSDAITPIVLQPNMVYANLWALCHSYSFHSISWGPAEGDFKSGEDTEKLVSNVLEGDGDLLGGVWAQVCYAAYQSHIVCNDYYVVWDGSVAGLPFD